MNIQNKYSTFGKRFLSGIIDGLVFIPFIIFDNYFNNIENNIIFIGWRLLYIFCWMLYVVIGHGKYGQTLGKKITNIKVLSIDEQKTIGYKRAFLRESVWFLADVVGIIYFLIASNKAHDPDLRATVFDVYWSITALSWLFLELVTMLFNNKRRALHDYIAGSVVVKLEQLKK